MYSMSEIQMRLIFRHNTQNMWMIYASSDVDVCFQHLQSATNTFQKIANPLQNQYKGGQNM